MGIFSPVYSTLIPEVCAVDCDETSAEGNDLHLSIIGTGALRGIFRP